MNGVEAFHDIVGALSYPMAIVTAAADGERSGCLVGFHTQCSMDPPRYLVCISRRNHTAGVAAKSDHLAVHLLDKTDNDLAVLFGEQTGDLIDKFGQCSWTDVSGVPLLEQPRAWFVGRVLARYEDGDHDVYVMEPVAAELTGNFTQLAFPDVKNIRPGHHA